MEDCSCENQQALNRPGFDSINSRHITALGHLQVRGPVSAEQLSRYHLDEGLNCFRPSAKQHSALIELAEQPDGLIFITALANTVVSYASFQTPDYPWWQERCFPRLTELGSIETAPSWRKMGLINILMTAIFLNLDFAYFEDFIIIAVQFIQSWDLRNTGLSPWAYRQFMLDLFGKYGFVTWETIDPEIREHPCNILVARVGTNINVNLVKHFSNCCLGTQ